MKKELNVVNAINTLEGIKDPEEFNKMLEVIAELANYEYLTSDEFAIILKYFKMA